MRDVIQKVMAAETEAKRLVEEARAEADRILSDARRKGQDTAARAYQEAGAEADRIVAAAIDAAEKEKQENLARAAAEMASRIGFDEPASQRVVDWIVRHVCAKQ